MGGSRGRGGWCVGAASGGLPLRARAAVVDSPAMAGQGPTDARDRDIAPAVGTPLQLLGLSARAFHFLTDAGITTIEEIDRRSDRELLKVQNFGQRGLEETRA